MASRMLSIFDTTLPSVADCRWWFNVTTLPCVTVESRDTDEEVPGFSGVDDEPKSSELAEVILDSADCPGRLWRQRSREDDMAGSTSAVVERTYKATQPRKYRRHQPSEGGEVGWY